MNDRLEKRNVDADPAAIFGAAMSLWDACYKSASSERTIRLSEAYQGIDQLMREVMRIAECFEGWACDHVDFGETDDVWTYFLHDRFGAACLTLFGADELASFDEEDCLRVAMQLGLPVRLSDDLKIPVDLSFPNPSPGSAFRGYRIQTMRLVAGDGGIEAFISGDDPRDEEYGAPFFSIHALHPDGKSEWIADRSTYDEAANLLGNLIPAIPLPKMPLTLRLVPLRVRIP